MEMLAIFFFAIVANPNICYTWWRKKEVWRDCKNPRFLHLFPISCPVFLADARCISWEIWELIQQVIWIYGLNVFLLQEKSAVVNSMKASCADPLFCVCWFVCVCVARVSICRQHPVEEQRETVPLCWCVSTPPSYLLPPQHFNWNGRTTIENIFLFWISTLPFEGLCFVILLDLYRSITKIEGKCYSPWGCKKSNLILWFLQ